MYDHFINSMIRNKPFLSQRKDDRSEQKCGIPYVKKITLKPFIILCLETSGIQIWLQLQFNWHNLLALMPSLSHRERTTFESLMICGIPWRQSRPLPVRHWRRYPRSTTVTYTACTYSGHVNKQILYIIADHVCKLLAILVRKLSKWFNLF